MSERRTAEVSLIDRLGEEDRHRAMVLDVQSGLLGESKELSPKYFYDQRGSELFEEITSLPEYYQTRTERSILGKIVDDLASAHSFTDLIEFGSGSSEKTRLLLETLSQKGTLRTYHPIDVSRDFLMETSETLAEDYPEIEIAPVLGDFADGLDRIETSGPTLSVFLGGTIGNLYPEEAIGFLRRIREGMKRGDALLLGCDLVKDPTTLHNAYNDTRGVTAAFNRNVLLVLNRELDAEFDPDSFAHYAFYSPREQRIEMHLISLQDQSVHIGAFDEAVSFEEGETVLTEISRKFTRRSGAAMLEAGGFTLLDWSTDPEGLFALALALPSEDRK